MKRIVVLVVMGILFFSQEAVSQDMEWESVTPGVFEVREVLLSSKQPSIYIASSAGVFKTTDMGKSWQLVLKLKDAIFLFEDRNGFLYAGGQSELYFSDNQAQGWRRLYRGRNGEDSSLTTFTVVKEDLYLGTTKGLLVSKDKGRTWQRISSVLGHLRIIRIVYAPNFNLVYVLTEKGIYQLKPDTGFYQRVFVEESYREEPVKSEIEEEKENLSSIRDLQVDKEGNIYIATKNSIMVSKDNASSWQVLNTTGLISKDTSFLYIKGENLYAVNPAGIFLYQQTHWQEISLRLPPLKIFDIKQDNTGNLFVATDRGLFRSQKGFYFLPQEIEQFHSIFKDEPDILEVQKRALKYAGIVEPQIINNHRNLARLKAILPTLKIDYDKTVTYYSNTNSTRFATGPLDWGISLSWNLSDLIWSEQQRLIDSQTRLLIELRNDLLDEVNKLYFERLRIKQELLSIDLKPEKRIEKLLKLKELTASLDALTDGYFSSYRDRRQF